MTRGRLVRMLALVLALVLVAAACGDDGGGGDDPSDDAPADDDGTDGDDAATTTAPTTTAPIPEGGEAITGVSITAVVFGDEGSVTITNDSDAEVTVDGLWVCNRPNYTPLSGTIPPGGTLQVPAADLRGLSIDGGEAALFASNSFDSPDAMLDYVQWGAGGGRESVAVAAGIWTEGGSVEPDPELGAIERFDAAGGPDAWE